MSLLLVAGYLSVIYCKFCPKFSIKYLQYGLGNFKIDVIYILTLFLIGQIIVIFVQIRNNIYLEIIYNNAIYTSISITHI